MAFCRVAGTSDRFKTEAARWRHAVGMTSRDGHLQPPGGRTRPGVILALVCAAQFMLILDLVVVNVALPTMQKDLRLSPSDLQWVVIIYGLAFGGFLLLGGRAADLLGRRNVLVAGLTMFTAGSLAAGLAGSLAPLAGLVMGSFLVVEGQAAKVSDPAELRSVADTFESKYSAHFTAPEGTWFGLGDTIRRNEALVFRVAPSTAFGFGKGTPYSQTRWSFPK